MKKIVLSLTALALSVSVVCAKPAKKSKAKMKNVYLITMDQMDQYWVRVNEGAKKAAAEDGSIKYRWIAPDIKDDSKQIECINNAVAAGADAILLAANGPTAITSAVKEAAGKGIKIIYVDSPADYPAVQTLSTDNRSAGKNCRRDDDECAQSKGDYVGFNRRYLRKCGNSLYRCARRRIPLRFCRQRVHGFGNAVLRRRRGSLKRRCGKLYYAGLRRHFWRK